MIAVVGEAEVGNAVGRRIRELAPRRRRWDSCHRRYCLLHKSITHCVCVRVSFRVLEEREREGGFENIRVTIKTVRWDFDLYDFGSQSVRLRKRYIF